MGCGRPCLPRDSTEDGEAGNEEEVLDAQVEVSANPYPFHWCTGLLFCLYALLLNRMIGFFLLMTGLLIVIAPRQQASLCKKAMLASAYYMSFLWLGVYIIVSGNMCRGYMEGLGLCDGRMKNVNRFFETHLLSILPIFSILVMKQVRLYNTKKASIHWIHCVYVTSATDMFSSFCTRCPPC